MKAIETNESNDKIDTKIVHRLITMFDDVNELVKLFQTKRDEFEDLTLPMLQITMLDRQSNDSRQYE